MALARLAWTLSLALNAGIDARRAIRMALQSTQNRYYTQHTAEVDAVIVRGGQFHEALRRSGAFPEEFLTALENAEITGTESESLTRLSEDYQQRAETATLALTVAASFAIWALVAGADHLRDLPPLLQSLPGSHSRGTGDDRAGPSRRGNRFTCGIRIAAPARQCRPPPIGSRQPGSAGTPFRGCPARSTAR